MSSNTIEICAALRCGGSGLDTLARYRVKLLEAVPELPARSQLPFHMTTLWLGHHAPGTEPRVCNILRKLAFPERAIHLEGFDILCRGDTTAIVARLASSDILRSLQQRLKAELLRTGVHPQDRFTGANYTPHITLCDGFRDAETARHHLANVKPNLVPLIRIASHAQGSELSVAGWFLFREHGDLNRPIDCETIGEKMLR